MENWKPVPGHEHYEASQSGQVRNRATGQVLKPWLRAGYPTINLRNGPDRKLRSVHTVIAETWIGPRPGPGRFHCVHLDGNRANSAAANLGWATPSENEQQKREHGTYARGQFPKVRAFNDGQAALVREIVGLGVSQTRLADLLGVTVSTVSNIVRGKFYQ